MYVILFLWGTLLLINMLRHSLIYGSFRGVKIGYLFGRLKNIYAGMFKDLYRMWRVQKDIEDLEEVFTRYGYFILGMGMIVKLNALFSQVEY